MEGLRRRLSQERRRRRLRWAASAALAAALLWLAGPGRERPTPPLLLAEVPRTTAPLFEPSAGSAVRLSSGALLVRSGGGS